MKKTLLALLCACGTGINPVATEPQPPPGPDKYYGEGSPLTSPCVLDAQSQRGVLAGSTEKEAFLLRGDGAKKVLAASTFDQEWVGPPIVRGRYLAVPVSSFATYQYRTRVELFDTQGDHLASIEGVGQPVLSENGVVAISTTEQDLSVVRSDGSTALFSKLMPAGDFGPAALLPVWKDDTGRVLALLDATWGEVTDLPIPLSGYSQPIWAGDLLVYIGELDGKTVLVRRGPSGTLTTPLPSTDTFGGLSVEQVTATTAVLVTGSWVQVRSRLDLTTGAVTPMNVEPPAGFTFAGRHSASLADDGSLVAAFNANGSAGLYRSLDGKAWASMGAGISGVTSLNYVGRQGAWLVLGFSMLGARTSMGLVPAMGLTQLLPAAATIPSTTNISADGRCAAIWSGEGDRFTLTGADLVSGSQRALVDATTAGTAVWLR